MDRSSILRASTTHSEGRVRGLLRSGSGAENAARLKPRRLRAKNDRRPFLRRCAPPPGPPCLHHSLRRPRMRPSAFGLIREKDQVKRNLKPFSVFCPMAPSHIAHTLRLNHANRTCIPSENRRGVRARDNTWPKCIQLHGCWIKNPCTSTTSCQLSAHPGRNLRSVQSIHLSRAQAAH